MRIEHALIAEEFAPSGAGGDILGAMPVCSILLDTMPRSIGVMLVAFLAGHPREADRFQTLECRVLGPSLVEVAPALSVGFQNFAGPGGGGVPDGWEGKSFLPIRCIFDVAEPGTYSVELSVGSSSVSVPMEIFAP